MIEVKIYSCYKLTYTQVYEDILRRIYGNNIDLNNVKLTIEDISNNGTRGIQSQRSLSSIPQRTIRVYEDEILKHIIGLSNTNFDLDKKEEYENGITRSNQYGVNNYHANSYLKQGINKIFELYFDNKNTADLSFYLLDTDKDVNYPNNLFNVLSYRELESIGFKILNIENIDFTDYERQCSSTVNKKHLAFGSFNKYIRDISYISERNSGNKSSFLKVEEHYDDGYCVDKYVYILKALSAQGYDSLLRCWCMKILADRQNTKIEFKIGRQYFGYERDKPCISENLTGPINNIMKKAGLNIEPTTYEEFLNEVKTDDNDYIRHKEANNLRNQSLFRKNMRRIGMPEVCVICGEDNTRILEAAHLWEVSKISKATKQEIDEFIQNNTIDSILDLNNEHRDELFYKKYKIANAGENGVWMCNNHHGLFDSNYFCIDSEDGKILLKFGDDASAREFAEEYQNVNLIESGILTERNKPFFVKRQLAFSI